MDRRNEAAASGSRLTVGTHGRDGENRPDPVDHIRADKSLGAPEVVITLRSSSPTAAYHFRFAKQFELAEVAGDNSVSGYIYPSS
jgi:hypothetical protein